MIDQTVQTGQYIVLLIRSILNDEVPSEKPGGVLFGDVFRMSREHMISAMTYAAVENLQIKPEGGLLEKWSQSAYTNIAQSVVQLAERDSIYKALERHKIPYIPYIIWTM